MTFEAVSAPDSYALLVRAALHAPYLLVFPVLVLLEAFYLLTAWVGVLRRRRPRPIRQAACGRLPTLPLWPRVSCIVTCYSEGVLVERTILSLLDQDYQGVIEILPVIDGALQNHATQCSAQRMLALTTARPTRCLRIIPKWIRGGRASSLNAGLALASGDIVLALDGDTSFDCDMISRVLGYFAQDGVIAVAGTLRVRNLHSNWLTRLQALDYVLFRQFVRAGLGELEIVNNIPGAHGAFRADVLRAVGGWDNGAAEDVDMVLRLKKHFSFHPSWRIAAAPDVISHTDVPDRWGEFLRQRLRWEGDPVYLHLRKHGPSLRPSLMGWRASLFSLWYGVVFQVLMPPTLVVGVVMLWLSPHRWAAMAAFGFGYALYLLAAALLLLTHLAMTSERPAGDVRLATYLPVYPLFIFLIRFWSGLAVWHNLLLSSHRDTSMAPWWVLRKGRF